MRDFLSWLKSRGLRGVRMFTGDKAVGMVGSIAEVFGTVICDRFCTDIAVSAAGLLIKITFDHVFSEFGESVAGNKLHIAVDRICGFL